MENLLIQLQQLGVHYIKNHNAIMLEILENRGDICDIDRIIYNLIEQLPKDNINKLLLECPKSIFTQFNHIKTKLLVTGERVVYTLPISQELFISVPYYEVWALEDNKSILLLAEIMKKSVDATRKFISQMKEELPSQANMMLTVYIRNNEPVGIVLPHIEPNTNNEGRIFWIGIHPKFLGKGFGKNLHMIGLYRLITDFHAKTYLGITNIDNYAMKKIMIANGCSQNETTLVSLEYASN